MNSFAKPVRKSTTPYLQQHAQQVAHLSAELRRNADELSIMQKELMELHRKMPDSCSNLALSQI
ncbi:hypothetical protein [Pseudomonas synxantha]|uniref:Uncharacterized protein n=1 Tax=Pseudomonas synxantha TaxID=47883 RepID=A0ACC6JRB4_9PSED|nr:hypothetical protein [Pseudomonas synxantha]MDR6609078.1 hypothetical protein [Pseudomonas synxantha]